MGRRVTLVAGALALAGLTGCGAAVIGHGSLGARPTAGGRASALGSGSPEVPAVASPPAAPGRARFADPAVAATVLAAARHDVEVVSSYDYRRLPQSLAAGLAVSTGAFREQYRTAFTAIGTAATASHLVQRATVTAVGLGPSAGDRATLLVFGQTTSHGTAAGDHTDPFTARVDLSRVGPAWLIDGFTLDGAIDGAAAGTPALAEAVTAARRGTAAVLTYHRSTFAADLVGAAPAVAVVTAADDVVVVLVAATEVQSGPGRTPVATRQRLRVTLRNVLGSWRLSDAAAVGLR